MTISPPPAELPPAELPLPAPPQERREPEGAAPPRAVVGEWIVELARPDDDASLRRLVAVNPVPGRITLAFEREPSYFAGCRAMGPFTQVAVARHRSTGAIGAMSNRAIRPRFVNGAAQPVGYLSQLRVDAPHRGQWLGAALLRGVAVLHADGRTAGYLATIADDSPEAHGLMVARARPGFPTFRAAARLRTLALYARPPGGSWLRRRQAGDPAGLDLASGRASDLAAIVSFLRQHGAGRQFFPAVAETDFGPDGTLPGLAPEDFVVARRGGEMAGVAALWDQRRLKQTVVRGYGGALRRLRPAYNLVARALGAAAPPLPPPGAHLRSAYASFLTVADDDAATARAILRRLVDLAAARGLAYVLVGLSEGDPLLQVAQRFPHVAYGSTLYTVCVPGDGRFHALPDGRPPQVEIATL